MILICPSCAKRYRLAPGSLGAGGRMVRCQGCGHVWRAMPEATLPPGALPPEPSPPEEPLPPPVPPRAPAPAPSARLAGLVAWLVVLLLLVVIGGLWVARERVVAAVPALARYYAGLGIAVRVPSGLEIRHQTSERRRDADRELLLVRGEVFNPADEARDVPAVRVALLDRHGAEVAFALVNAAASRLEPGTAAGFEVVIPDPPATAESYRVTLEAR